jgi:hypothetical protein
MAVTVFRDDASGDEIVSRLLPLITLDVPHVPQAGPQADWAAATGEADDPSIVSAAGQAVRRLLDLGATTEDLYAISRGITAEVLMDAVTRLAFDDGGLAGELHYAIDEATRAL